MRTKPGVVVASGAVREFPGDGAGVRRSRPPASFIWVTALWTFGIAIADPFLDAYLWSLRSSWVLIGTFNLAQYLAMVFTFPLAGWLAKRRGARLPLRLAVLAVAATFLSALALGPAAPRQVLGLGLALGAGWGLYWLAQFVFSLDLTVQGRGRDRWQSLAGLLNTGSGLLAPLAAGSIVAAAGRMAGFRWLLAAGLGFLAAALIAAVRLPVRREAEPYRLRSAMPGLHAPGRWAHVLLAHLALALRDGVYLFAPALLIFALSGSALNLGAYLSATQLASLGAYAAFERWGTPELRRPALVLGSILSTAAGLILAAGLDVTRVWAFGLLAAALRPLLRVPIESLTLDVIARRSGTSASRVEHTVVKEVAVNAARVVSIGAMVAVIASAGPGVVRWWLAGVSVTPWFACWALRRLPDAPGATAVAARGRPAR